MIWLRLFQIAGIFLFLAFVVTQIIIPSIFNRKLFPLFRKSQKQLSAQYAELNQQLYEVDLKDKVDELDRKLHPTTPSVTPAPTVEKADETQTQGK